MAIVPAFAQIDDERDIVMVETPFARAARLMGVEKITGRMLIVPRDQLNAISRLR